jgi:hypothetical protein
MTSKEELVILIQQRNKEVRKDHERRYGKVLPDEPEEAKFKRIFNNPNAWEKI